MNIYTATDVDDNSDDSAQHLNVQRQLNHIGNDSVELLPSSQDSGRSDHD
eukprot:CAMPEP_0201577100 /NCGR_PEP_ID=MMETSP0190_2-20130828/23321_1 /ASSEMBLY_ACC=CAM_ASM_000263 /TAXON_ID=37353 /ORGANISM="Rosalina sp." /LENGTH=49 /DNA_ID=CAMNT_0048008777 /DNA_START=971 /DNA_END=1120 /DNA_ORIENTATION=+